MSKQVKKISKQKIKNISSIAYIRIKSTFNNTIINITDEEGNTLFIASTGSCGFKGAKKRTPFAAQAVADKVGTFAFSSGVKQAHAFLCGPGNGRESSIRALKACGLELLTIKDFTPVPHNGCRPSKKRRL